MDTPIRKRPDITLRPCQSSQISAYGYDAGTSTLAVRFKHGGRLYHYFDVPQAMATAMDEAESKGAFVMQRIKTGGFNYERIDEAEPEKAAEQAS